MEARVIVVCLFVVVLVCEVQGQVASLCRPNERLLECGCPRTCQDPAPNCKAVCRTGCFCEEGQVRDDKGLCIKLADCPRIMSAYLQDTSEPRDKDGRCPENEEYRFCEPCNKTCDNPNPICPAQCARGCFCKDDMLRNKDGQCVKPEKCPKTTTTTTTQLPTITPIHYQMTCSEHQVYKRCEICEKTCSNPNPKCPNPCSMGCFCEEGYVKSPNGLCVKLNECPQATTTTTTQLPTLTPIHYRMTCSEHQVYKRCETCEKTCSNPKPKCPTPCSMGCFCEAGYVKSPNGLCVKLNECPKAEFMIGDTHEPLIEDCSPDEEYYSCGWCEASCSNPSPSCPIKICTRGCLCRSPLLRHHSGHCVEEKDCFPQKCKDSNEEYVCRYGCEPRCETRECVRPRGCVLGCHCRLGLLRDGVSGLCVMKQKCSNTTDFNDIA